jgi:hypothetical protein
MSTETEPQEIPEPIDLLSDDDLEDPQPVIENVDLIANPYQGGFLRSQARYPALISAVGTGKTYFFLLKIVQYCQMYPGSLAMVVRKEFTDLRDSTMKDFETYFPQLKIRSDKNCIVPCNDGPPSIIMFRHGAEANVLKNINLSIFGIEQAEEFLTDDCFTFLRDRLRRPNAPYRQGIVIGNVQGHNWIWKNWKASKRPEYDLYEANTFANAHNLPADFVKDLKAMEQDAPAHYRRYVLNDWDEESGIDVLLPRLLIEAAWEFKFPAPTGGRIISCDPARYGECDTVITIVQRADENQFEQTHVEGHNGWNAVRVISRLMEIAKTANNFDAIIVDANGLGGGIADVLIQELEKEELKIPVIEYNGGEGAGNKKYLNKRAVDCWNLRELLTNKRLKVIKHDKQAEQLASYQFGYRTNGQRYILSKEEMRSKGLKSPDYGDSLVMAASALQMLRPANPPNSPKVIKTKEFWGAVNKDIERFRNNEEGWSESV